MALQTEILSIETSDFSYLLLHSRAVAFVLCGDPKNLPVHSFKALIILVLRYCLLNYFSAFLSFDIYQLAVPRRLYCFGSLVVLVVCGYVVSFLLDIKTRK